MSAAERIGNGGAVKPEVAINSIVEIRPADLEKNAPAVARIFSQPRTIEHLSGIAPSVTRRDIPRFRKNIQNLMPDVNLQTPIIIAVRDEIEAYYVANASAELYVAVDTTGKVIGTVTLERSGAGIVWMQVSRLAVSEEARGKGIGTNLLNFANHRIDELGTRGSSAGIIRGVEGDGIPLHLFEKVGYVAAGTLRDICVGWSNAEERFVYRNSLRMQREIPRGSFTPELPR